VAQRAAETVEQFGRNRAATACSHAAFSDIAEGSCVTGRFLNIRLAYRFFLRDADFLAFLADACGFRAVPFLWPKIASQPSEYFFVVPTRTMLMSKLQVALLGITC
jgi:hypothetical protein